MTVVIEPFRDASLTIEARVADLLPRLTLREKVGQLNQRMLGWNAWWRDRSHVHTTDELAAEVERWGGMGALYGMLRADAWSGRDWSNGASPELSAEVAAAVQERVVAASRFGIPALFVEEAPHGHQALGSQLFPTGLGVAASWRPDLLEAAAAHSALELKARGAHLALIAGLDVLRDPRWGRAEECFGEDPLLDAQFMRAMVRGIQSVPGIAAVIKHFAGQGAPIGGRNSSGTPIGPRELRELHLPAPRAAIDEGALGVMAAYNDIDGIPCCANEGLLTGILRDEWGFEGIVMADMFAVDRLLRSSASPAEAGAIALRAGVDLSMCDVSYEALEEAVDAGLATVADVDRAAGRMLALKIRLGLLDAPVPLPSFPAPDPAAELVAATAVLLQNRGSLLPLAAVPARIAVIGPNADDLDALLGDYVPPLREGEGTTVLAGIRAVAPDAVVTHEAGSTLSDPLDGGLARATAAAADADLVVLVLGSSSGRGYDDDFQTNGAAALGGAKPHATTGEGFDSAEVRLPAAQRDLVAAVAATGSPIVALIVSGRPNGISAVTDACDAVISAWYPGPSGGQSLAELVLGDREPTGRLPVSLPGSSGVLPVAYNERRETTLRYVDADAAAEHPFGSGLGFTIWSLGAAAASTTATAAAALPSLTLTAPLTNTGARPGTQVVQLYARARIPGLLPRRAVLLGYTWMSLDAGATASLSVAVDRDAIDGLGVTPDDLRGGAGTLELWLSTTGAGEPEGAVEVTIS